MNRSDNGRDLNPERRARRARANPRRALCGLGAALATLLPAFILGALVYRYGVNVPFWDEWSLLELFNRAHLHQLSFADLFAQNNEHRIVFPKLLFLLLEYFNGWNTRAEMFLSVGLCALTGVCLQWLLRRTLSGPTWRLLLVGFTLNLLLFSPCQHENWLWGYQLACFLLNLCLVAGVVVICSEVRPAAKFLLAGACALVATFSGGNGMLLWPLLLMVFLLRCENFRDEKILRWTAGWIAAGVGAVALYFFHYQQPSWHPPLLASRHPLDYYSYLTAFLGSALGRHEDTASLTGAVVAGSAALLIFAAVVAFIAWRWRDASIRRNAAPWLAIAGFGLLSALLACITRIGFGAVQALESRYTTFSLLFLISIIPLSLIAEESRRAGNSRGLRALNLLLLAGALGLLFLTLPFALTMMRKSHEKRARGHIALTFLKCFEQKTVLEQTIHPNLQSLTLFAERANTLHLLTPPLFDLKDLAAQMAQSRNLTGACGALDRIDRTGNESYLARGWAILPATRQPADGVLLGYRTGDGGSIPFTIAYPDLARPDLAKFYQRPSNLAAGWQTSFIRSQIPRSGACEIEAWAFDIRRLKLCQMAGDGRID